MYCFLSPPTGPEPRFSFEKDYHAAKGVSPDA
jgi:hypothetical protein